MEAEIPVGLMVLVFIFICIFTGALIRQLLKNFRFPYTVIIFLLGFLVGYLGKYSKLVKRLTALSDLDPMLMMHVFLPVLIFESAFGIEAHMFKRALGQCIVLAGPGMLFCTGFIGAFAMLIYKNEHWKWTSAFLLGSILSATDPVAVVALLKECGISPTLTTIIEGESLLNDGVAIVIFYVLKNSLEEDQHIQGFKVLISSVKNCVGAPVFGFLVAHCTIWLLSQVYNDSVVEITFTLSVAYMSYNIADEVLGISGVLAVTTLGVILSANKGCISPEATESVHHFWEMLSYIANTLIFMLVGIIIADQAADKMVAYDLLIILGMYVAVTVIRFAMLALLAPVLIRMGYGLTFKQVLVMTWGGLRGAVGLALSLILREIDQNAPSSHMKTIADKVLIQVSGIILLTLVVNGTTMEYILKLLGMREVSPTDRVAMKHAVDLLNDVAMRSTRVQGMNKFTIGANWEWVKKMTTIEDPYEHMGMANTAIYTHLLPLRYGVCRECVAQVAVNTTEEELMAIREASRIRILKALKTSLWNQYETGLINRRTVQLLMWSVDDAADTPGKYLLAEDIVEEYMAVSRITPITERCCAKILKFVTENKPEAMERVRLREDIRKNKPVRAWCIRTYLSPYFLPFFIAVRLTNAIPLVWELYLVYSPFVDKHAKIRRIQILDLANLIYVSFYVVEAVIVIIALQWKNYIKERANKFAFLVLILAAAEGIVDVIIYMVEFDKDKFVNYLQFLIYLRFGRVARAAKSLVYSLMVFLQNQVSAELFNIYDVGHGFTEAYEGVKTNMSFLIDYTPCANEPTTIATENIMKMVTYLEGIEEQNPSVVVALKSHVAARKVLNDMLHSLQYLQEKGLAEEEETNMLQEHIEEMIKHNLHSALNLPRNVDIHAVLANVDWIRNETLYQIIFDNIVIRTIKAGQLVIDFETEPTGIYIVSAGVVRVSGVNECDPGPSLPNADSLLFFEKRSERFVDYKVASNSLGILGFLVQTPYMTTSLCETDCQLLYITPETLDHIEREFEQDLYFAMWKPIALKMSEMLMRKEVQYEDWTDEAIKLRLQKAMLPNLHHVEIFEVNRAVQDIILIQGRVADLASGTVYAGPCYIPNTAKSLHLKDDPGLRHRVVMVFLTDEEMLPRNTLMWCHLDDISGQQQPCMKHSARRRTVMIQAGEMPPRELSVRLRKKSSIAEEFRKTFSKKNGEQDPASDDAESAK